jgi:hypothetical protein
VTSSVGTGRLFVRGDLWGGPFDGRAVVMALPPRLELRFDTTRADGSAAVAHYCLWSGLGAPWVTLDADRDEPLDEATRARLLALLEGKRGMRYWFVGMR